MKKILVLFCLALSISAGAESIDPAFTAGGPERVPTLESMAFDVTDTVTSGAPSDAAAVADLENALNCRSSRDCLSATEHCLKGRCELRSSRCFNNFDCSGTDKCNNGVCRPL